MAVYKVPQDVEADDKLIGPFSFRQFIYLIIVAISGALAWGLAQLFIPLAILPLPLIIFFGALALPLRKDQPMEIYLAAIVSFYLKPRRRLWVADGVQSLVEITAPKVVEVQRTKNLSQGEAEQRLSYLAQIADSQGWAVRGVASAPVQNSPMNDDLYFEAQQMPDILDTTGGVARTFDTKLAQADSQRHQDMVQRMQQPAQPAPAAAITTTAPQPAVSLPPATQPPTQEPHLSFNPYPSAMHQSVVQPLSDSVASQAVAATQAASQVNTSEKPVSPDIISLASNPDLSIETIAHEAQRIQKKEAELDSDEVVISLR
ncbi:MAG: hypothetical protein JWO61_38 [Candidatus Saccharibacteria bacterium]|nr:hypothetical protein [Candidatus Saccharibacteria bacterium]